jgi:hypothetical protein
MFVREANAADAKLRETWDRLVLFLIAEPRKGWEREFHEITRREVERLEANRRSERGPEHTARTPRPTPVDTSIADRTR